MKVKIEKKQKKIMKKSMSKIVGQITMVAILLGTIGVSHAIGTTFVTPDSFIRAETDNMYHAMIKNAGGTNKFFHFRNPTPLDKQTVVRMNRDVLYSGGVFDAKKELTLLFPAMPDDRYASVYVIDNDHYAVNIIHEPGIHKIKGKTRFLYLIVRVQVKDAFDQKEIKMINSLQDKFIVTSETNADFPAFIWDKTSLNSLSAKYKKESLKYDSWAGMMGARGQVNEETRHIAAASAWGLFPEEEATYLNYKGTSTDGCYQATYSVPENYGFWSITLYGDDGFMKSDNNLINESNVQLNKDDTFTAHFGSEDACGKVTNHVDISPGWNFLLRIYQPGQSVLDGKYNIPNVTLLSNGG